MTAHSMPWLRADVQSAPLVGPQCSMFMRNWLFDEVWQCEGESTHIVKAGCVHEHVAEYTVCDECAKKVRADLANAALFCNRCTESAESHECPITASIEPWSIEVSA